MVAYAFGGPACGARKTRNARILDYLPCMLLRNSSARPSGFVEPCRPSKATRPPSGPQWVHEIKHDGFRLMVRREGVAGALLHPRRA